MRIHPLTLILLYGLLAGTAQASSTNRLEVALENFTSYSYDEIHRIIVLNQVREYIKPVKSLETRDVRSLNGLYDFCFDPGLDGFKTKFFDRPLADVCREGDFHRMPVPSAFNEVLSNKSAKNYAGWMWYQTSALLNLPQHSTGLPGDENVNWILQIESINYLSIIWASIIDDTKADTRLVGAHAGGHLPITMNISSLLSSTRSHQYGLRLRLTVAVSNLLSADTIPSGRLVNMTSLVGRPYYKFQPDFDFFNFAGIMGDVQIIRLSEQYIEQVEVLPRKEAADGAIQVEICLNVAPSCDLTVVFHAEDCRGLIVNSLDPSRCCSNSSNEICASERCFRSIIRPPDGLTDIDWPSSPRAAKRLHVSLILRALDVHLDSFEFKLVRRAALLPYDKQLQGFGMHHEQLFSGRTMSLASIMKDLYLIKQMGANVIRTSHYPYSRAYLEACDELGLMVIAESPAVGLNTFSDLKLTLHKQMLLEMMQRDHEHPAIVLWSLANEPQSQLPEARAYFKSLVQYARADLERFTVAAGRPLTAAIAQSHHDDTIGDLLDVLMINQYFGWYDCTGVIECIRHSLLGLLTGWAARYGPEKPLIVSEFGADTIAGQHSTTSEIFSEEYQRELIIEHEKVFDELFANRSASRHLVNFLGSMIWNFADFSTHESLLRVGGNKKGLFTRAREPKLAAESVRRIYTARLLGGASAGQPVGSSSGPGAQAARSVGHVCDEGDHRQSRSRRGRASSSHPIGSGSGEGDVSALDG